MAEEKKDLKAEQAKLERERREEAEKEIQQLCKSLDITIVPVVQIIPGQTPSATLMVQLNK